MYSDRIPPADLDAERAVLGVMLLEGRSAVERIASSHLRTSDFYTDVHRVLYAAIAGLHRDGQPVDLITLTDRLREEKTLDVVGGPITLGRLVEHASMLVHLDAYAEIVVNQGKRREVIQACARVITAAYDEDGLAGMTDTLGAALDGLTRRRLVHAYDPAVSWSSIVSAWGEGRIKTGIAALDRLTGGVSPGEFIILPGRSSHGKTAFGVGLLRRFSAAGVTADYLTLEETEDSITRRLVAGEADLSVRLLKDGALTQAEFDRAEAAIRTIQALPLRVVSLDGMATLDEDTVLSAVMRSEAQVVIVDHLQKITTRDASRAYGVERVLNRLHAFAIRRQRVVILLYQLNREIDQRKSPPVLSDLRDSGAAEITARQIWAVYWPQKYHPTRPAHEFELWVLKQSDGGTGMVPLTFDPRSGRFTDAPWSMKDRGT